MIERAALPETSSAAAAEHPGYQYMSAHGHLEVSREVLAKDGWNNMHGWNTAGQRFKCFGRQDYTKSITSSIF